jgi:uncharacterized protein (TIGR00730 family)
MTQSNYWREKTYNNPDFLNSPAARQIRILCELTAPKVRFEENQIENTIVFFGSARSVSSAQAQEELRAIKKATGPQDARFEQRLAKARAGIRLAHYYDASKQLAQKLTEWSQTIEPARKRFYICSGGGPGMMEAANRGSLDAGGESIGLNISLPFEQAPNPYQTPRVSFEFHYFFIRKFWFAYLAKGLVVFPGGFGTMDELFELLTLLQTRKVVKHIPIILFGRDFWERVFNFEALLEWGVISDQDLGLFQYFDDVDEAFQYLKTTLTREYLENGNAITNPDIPHFDGTEDPVSTS